MKILVLQHESDVCGEVITTVYVGNEFSQDPIEVQSKIKMFLTSDEIDQSAFSRDLGIYIDAEKFGNVKEDILTVLRKAGYTSYIPHTVSMFMSEEGFGHLRD